MPQNRSKRASAFGESDAKTGFAVTRARAKSLLVVFLTVAQVGAVSETISRRGLAEVAARRSI